MRVAALLILTFVPLVAAIDGLLYLTGGVEATFSRVLYRWALSHPALPYLVCFGLGLLIGHLFLPQYVHPPRP